MTHPAKPLTFHKVWQIEASPDKLWPLVADTDRANEMMGNPPVRYVDVPDPRGGVRRQGSFRLRGVPLSWDEYPYEWVEPRELGVRRVYHGGPMAEFRFRVTLTPEQGGTRLEFTMWLTPRHALFAPAVRLVGSQVLAGFDKVYRHYAAYLQGQHAFPFNLTPQQASAAFEERCRAIARDLGRLGFDEAMVTALVNFVLHAEDWELNKMRPFELARRWGVERRELLRLFLHATKAGLLELKWDLLCPGCRGAKERDSSLADIRGQVHCPSCNINFEVDFGQSVELCFRPNPAVRKIVVADYCVGGPGRTPHVVCQALLEPGVPHDLTLELAPGTYRLRSPHVANHLTLTVHDEAPDAGATHGIRVEPAGFSPVSLDLDCRMVRLRLEAASPVQVVLERTAWADDIVTGAYVSAMQEFRTLFSSEVLAPDLELAVTRLAIMFTDLKSSTAMYEQLGDATAFRLVQQHFRILEAAIAAHRGAIVKTVGDAVMASFYDPADCVRAAYAIQTEIDRHNRAHPEHPAPIIVKLGAHVGPCIAVTLNERLDYFGTTVNVAARVQNEAVGGDIVLSQDLLEDPGVRSVLSELPERERSTFGASLKGLAASYDLTRIYPDTERPTKTSLKSS